MCTEESVLKSCNPDIFIAIYEVFSSTENCTVSDTVPFVLVKSIEPTDIVIKHEVPIETVAP